MTDGVGRHLRTLTRRWTSRQRRVDGTLVPEALTGEAQRRATAALLGVPASQVSDAMIQRLFARVTTRTGALRRDAVSRIQRTDAPARDVLERRPARSVVAAPVAPATRPAPPPPSSAQPVATPQTVRQRAEELNERAAADGQRGEKSAEGHGLWARVTDLFERVLRPNDA